MEKKKKFHFLLNVDLVYPEVQTLLSICFFFHVVFFAQFQPQCHCNQCQTSLHSQSNCVSDQPKPPFIPSLHIAKQKGNSNYTGVNEVCLQPPTVGVLACLCSQKAAT